MSFLVHKTKWRVCYEQLKVFAIVVACVTVVKTQAQTQINCEQQKRQSLQKIKQELKRQNNVAPDLNNMETLEQQNQMADAVTEEVNQFIKVCSLAESANLERLILIWSEGVLYDQVHQIPSKNICSLAPHLKAIYAFLKLKIAKSGKTAAISTVQIDRIQLSLAIAESEEGFDSCRQPNAQKRLSKSEK